MEKRLKIFEHSKEHHIIDLACFASVETWFDLSVVDRSQCPTLHHSPEEDSLVKGINDRGFECVRVSRSGDGELEDIVKQSIVGTMETFNGRVRVIISKAMRLPQV
jgi:hypothetical protein